MKVLKDALGRKEESMMNRIVTLPIGSLALALALVVGAGSPTPATAQSDMRTEEVRFAAGTTGTTLRGSIKGYESVVYRIGAEAGQRMEIRMRTDNGASYFNVYEPGRGPGDEALANAEQTGPMVPDLNVFDGVLPTSGVYSVSVYLYRNAARRDETANYSLDISITGQTGEVVQGDFADGLQGGPDFWEVRLGDPVGSLNVRNGPSTGAATIGRFPNTAILRNLGCRMNEGRRWCKIEATAPGGITGWVAGEFLAESGGAGVATQLPETPPAPAADTDALVPGTPYHATGTIACVRGADAALQDCAFGVVRESPGSGNGSVTVEWPEGGARVIYFEAGTPVSFDQSQADQGLEMTVTRTENGINIVFIGEERFEIPDSVIWGG
ncbi:SH3 domain-containing protein [Rhodovulum euryhalinum]|uniref:SH3 domain-containing protein n=1 Tax=Rhodovulum euryhalinum TaxID=35805 RepID=A0A4R2KEE6_9RHOB|nr:SH3 domain-containing protein [Rhodovulum euryhalinum]TCO68288.1 SH3 domain-containing protein [Rhodovulum euryhalinum]